MVRTRFAPSPTGFLHIGGARTALYSWAFAKKHQGRFILRVEDTDLERSTPESVQAIFDGMHWLGLDYDEGPFFQMQRMERYREVIAKMLDAGLAYHCYCSKEELDQMRADQIAAGQKARYDRRWRECDATPPEGVAPVVRFKNPLSGEVIIDDLIKGRVVIDNAELDDFIIARSDGTPTYNFCVVVDDWDMGITHVIRGDDHLNNTPRQINVLKALGAPLPRYAHLPMILGPDGVKLSKRHGAVSVTQYQEEGFLPEAVLNYLARLGWGYKDLEIFSMDEFIRLFELENVSGAPSRFDVEKLKWLNGEYMKALAPEKLAALTRPFLEARLGDAATGPDLAAVVALVKDRAGTLVDLAVQCEYFYRKLEAPAEVVAKHLTPAARPLLEALLARLETGPWTPEAVHDALHGVVAEFGVGFGKLGMPVRVAVAGTVQTPAVDQVLYLIGRDAVVARLKGALAAA